MFIGKCNMKQDTILTKKQTEDYCIRLTELLPLLRTRLGVTQEELGKISGVSRVTISQIESGRAKMNWLHFSALMMICISDRNAKELLYVRGLLDDTLLRFYQGGCETPQLNVNVDPRIICFLKEYTSD